MNLTDFDWIDRDEYPFRSHYLDTPEGAVHYVDEGEGEVLLFLHGNPSWSFMYRRLIRHFSANGFRCIAPDYLGFGLSDKPAGVEYTPGLHARHVKQLIEDRELKEITPVLHDWGGPIGMSYAIEHADNIKRLIVLNTWAWSLKGKLTAELYSAILGGPIGRFLCRHFNLFPRFIMPLAFGEHKLRSSDHRHYTRPFPTPESRDGQWMFVRAVIEESPLLDTIWSRRVGLSDKPVLFLWALSDPVFCREHLEKWRGAFLNHRLETFPGVGHYIAEEAGEYLIPPIESFLAEQ